MSELEADTGHRRRLGAYYTPTALTTAIVRWAVRRANDVVLEPSFGTCGFFTAAAIRLRELGARRPIDRLFGVEVDSAVAERALGDTLGVAPGDGRFLVRDFLAVKPAELTGFPFDVVVGNPPYVSHHNMGDGQKKSARELAAVLAYPLDGRASLWAYFVLHGLSFLRRGGRCAWILPRSFLHSSYAEAVRTAVEDSFGFSAAIEVAENHFRAEGASDGMVVLVADGFRGTPRGRMANEYVRDAVELGECLVRIEEARNKSPRSGNGRLTRVNSQQPDWLKDALAAASTKRLGDLARIEIGAVTGANHWFVLSDSDRRQHCLRSTYLTPAVAGARYLSGLRFTKKDFSDLQQQDHPMWLLDTARGAKSIGRRGSALRRYLAHIPRTLRKTNRTFRKRNPWHAVNLVEPPDAFLTYMTSSNPRLVLNECGAVPTNAVHALYFDPPLSKDEMAAISVGLLSSVGQLSAERTGRSLSGGLLKHEPSDARRIVVPVPIDARGARKWLTEIDHLIRRGESDAAREMADVQCLGVMSTAARERLLNRVDEELRRLRARRHRRWGNHG